MEPAWGCVESPRVVMEMLQGLGGDACAGAASSPAHSSSRNRNAVFLGVKAPLAASGPALFQGCFALWGLCVPRSPPSSRGETAPGNYRQSAWKIPGSLICSQNMFV